MLMGCKLLCVMDIIIISKLHILIKIKVSYLDLNFRRFKFNDFLDRDDCHHFLSNLFLF